MNGGVDEINGLCILPGLCIYAILIFQYPRLLHPRRRKHAPLLQHLPFVLMIRRFAGRKTYHLFPPD